MRDRLPLPKGVPRTLRFESVTFDVAALSDGRLAFGYYEGSRRVVIKRRTLEALRAAADRIATSILNAETAALDLTAEQRRVAVTAFSLLDPIGLHLADVARDVAEAHRIAGPVPIADLARAYCARGVIESPPAPSVLQDMLDELREDQRDDKYIRGLQAVLLPFVGAHRDLRAVTETQIRAWLRARKTRAGAPIGPRRRDNIRDAIVRLFNFAVAKKYLPSESAEMVQSIKRLSDIGQVTTFAPKEIGLLLEHVSARWRPWLVIAAFAGLRTSEIFRLEWKAFKWHLTDEDDKPHPVIAVERKVARKVRTSRKVPISRNLDELLGPYRQHVGALYPHTRWRTLEDQHQDEIDRLEEVTGLRWKNNVLRHSYGSYRLAIIKNVPQLAWEMGNSPQMIRESYNDPKDETEAKAYFAISIPDHENIVTMPLPLTFGK